MPALGLVMLKTLLLAAAATLTACTDAPATTAVSGLAHASVGLFASVGNIGEPAVHVSIAADGCPTLAEDVAATYDGQPLARVAAGGVTEAFEGPDCSEISFELAAAPANPGQPSTFVLHDATATWTVSGLDLLTNDINPTSALSHGQLATIAWPSAPTITGAYIEFDNRYGDAQFAEQLPDVAPTAAGAIVGNTLQLTLPATVAGYGTLAVSASRVPEPIRCDGPASCALSVSIRKDLAVTIE